MLRSLWRRTPERQRFRAGKQEQQGALGGQPPLVLLMAAFLGQVSHLKRIIAFEILNKPAFFYFLIEYFIIQVTHNTGVPSEKIIRREPLGVPALVWSEGCRVPVE